MLLAVIVAGVSSYLAVSRQPPTYEARATLSVGNALQETSPTVNDFNLPEMLAALYAPLANKEEVREKTKEALGLSSLPSYVARSVPNTPFIEIVVTDTMPERAQAVANELANQLILQSPTAPKPEDQERAAFINEQLDELQNNIDETREEIAAKQQQLQDATSAREIANLEGEIEGLNSKLRTLRSTFTNLLDNTGSGAVNTITLFNEAELPRRAIGPNSMMTVVVVAAIGFVLAFGAAYLLEFLDDTIKKPDDMKWVTNLPILPGIGKFGTDEASESKLITLTDPRSPTAETYRALRTNIKAAVDKGLHGTLLVTSSKPNEGKSVTSANLAIAMAQQGHNVLLIDADLRRPSQHHLFEANREPGLADLLHELNINDHINDLEGLLKGVLQRTPERRLILLTCGSVRPAAFELLSSEIMTKILDALTQRFDFIIIDTPPVLAVSDAVALSTQVDYVVMVAEAGRVRRKDFKDAEARLNEAHANIVGVALNQVKTQNTGFYYTYYQEYYDSKEMATGGGQGKRAAGETTGEKSSNGEWSSESVIQPQVKN